MIVPGLTHKRTAFGFWIPRPFWGRLWLWAIRHRHFPVDGSVREQSDRFELSNRILVFGVCGCGETIYVAVDTPAGRRIRPGDNDLPELQSQILHTLRCGVPARAPWAKP